MSRTAYHRAYYYANVERRRASARAARRKAREWQAVIRIVCEAVTEARNDKPPFGGLTQAGGWLYSGIAMRGVVRIATGERGCQYPPPSSGILVGKPTRRMTLNLHRGSQPVGARRIVGKRKWQQGNL